MVAAATTAVAAKIFVTPPQAAANPFHPDTAAHSEAIEPDGLPLRWHYSLDFSAPAEQSGGDSLLGLAGDDSAVYALTPSSQVVLALSLKDSSVLWVFPDQGSVPRLVLDGHTIATSVDSDTLFILSEIGPPGAPLLGGTTTFNLMAVEKASGKLAWQSANLLPQGVGFGTDVWSELCLSDSAIFFQLDGKLYGYSQDGKPLWPPLTMFVLNANSPSVANTSTPAVDNGVIFVGTIDGRLLAIDAASGVLSWSVQLGTAPVEASPAAASSMVYIGAADGYFYAFNAATGSPAWKTQLINLANYNKDFITGYMALMGAATVSNGVVYIQASVVDDGGFGKGAWLYALDGNTGKQLWKVDPSKLPINPPELLQNNAIGTPSLAPWYPAGNIVYTTIGMIANSSDYQTSLATIQAVVALNQQDGSLNSYYWAPVDGELLTDFPGYYPSGSVPVLDGMALRPMRLRCMWLIYR